MTSSLPDDYPIHSHNRGRLAASEPAHSIRSAASTEPELHSIRRSSGSTFNSAMEAGAAGGRSPTSFQFDEDILMDDGYGDELPDFVIEYFQTHSNALEEDLPEHIVEFIQSKAAALERRRKLEQLSDVPEQEETYTANEMRILRDAQRRLELEEQLDTKVIPDEDDIPMADDEHVIEADRLGLRRGPRQEVVDSDQEEAEEEPEDDFDKFFQRQESPEPQPQPAKQGKNKKPKAAEPSVEAQQEQEPPKKKKFNLRSISMPPKPNIRMPVMARPQLPKLKMPTFNLPSAGISKKDEQKEEQDEQTQAPKNVKGKGAAKKGKKAEAQKLHEERKSKRTQSASPMRQKINSTLSSWQNSLRASFGKGKPPPKEDSVNEFVEFSATPQKRSDEDHQYEEIQAPPPSMAAVTVVEGAQGMPSVTVTEAPPRNCDLEEEEDVIEVEEDVEGIVEEPIEDEAPEEDGHFGHSPILEEETMEGVENLPEAEEVPTDQDAPEEELDEEPLGVQQLPELRVDTVECQEAYAAEIRELPDANAEDVEKPTTAQVFAAKLSAKSKSALQATTAKSKQALQATKTKLDEISRDSLRKTKNTFNKENIQATGKKLQSKFNDTLQRTKNKGKAPPKSDDFAVTLPRKCSPSIFDSSTTPRKSRDYETSTPKVIAAPRRNRSKHAATGNYPSLPIRKRRTNRQGDTAFNNVSNTLHESPRMQPSQSLPADMNTENERHNVVLRPRRRGKGPRYPSSHHGADHRRHGVYNNNWQSTYTQGHRPQSAYFYSDIKNNALDEMAELDYRSVSQELHHIFYAPVNTLAAVSGSPIKKPERPSRSRNKKPSTAHLSSLQAEREIPEYYNVPPRRPHRGPSTLSLQPSSQVSLTGSRSQCSYYGDVDDRSSTTTLLSTLLGQNEPVIPKRTRNKTTQPVLDSYQTWPRIKAQAEPVPVAPKRNRSKVSVCTIEYPVPEEIEEVSDYVKTEEIAQVPQTPVPEIEPEVVPSAPRRKKTSIREEVPAPNFEGMTWPRTKRAPPPTAPKRDKKQRQSQVSLNSPVPVEEIQEKPTEINTEEETEEILEQTQAAIQAEEQEAIQMIDDAVDQVLAPSPCLESPPVMEEDPYATIEPRNREKPPRPPPPVLPPVPADETYNASTTGVPYDYIYAVPRRLQRPSEPSTSFHTMPRPARPPRAYWTIRPQRPPRRKTTVDFLDLEGEIRSRSTDPSDISDRTTFTGSARDLQSPPVVERMRFRPLPAPPRTKRTKSKETTDRSHYSNESDSAPSVPTPPKPPRRTGSIKRSPKPVHKQLPPNIPATHEDEELLAQPILTAIPTEEIHAQSITVAPETYLGNVPPFKVEESTETDGYEPIEVNDPTPLPPKVEEVSIATQTDPHPEFDDDLLAASQDYGEELHADIIPEEITPPAQKVDQESQSTDHHENSRTRESVPPPEQRPEERPKSRTPSISKPPPSFHQLRTPPPERHEHEDDDTPSCPPFPMSFSIPPISVNLPDRLHLTELEVDRLNVRELQANRLVVSAIDTLTLQVSELTSATGPLVVSLPAPVTPPAPEGRRPLVAITEATQTSFDIAPIAEEPTPVHQTPVADTTEDSTVSSTSQATEGSTPPVNTPQQTEVTPPLSGTSELKEESTSPSSTSETKENESAVEPEEVLPKPKEKLASDEAGVRQVPSQSTSGPLVQSTSQPKRRSMSNEESIASQSVPSVEEPEIELLGAVGPAPVLTQVPAGVTPSEPTIPQLTAQLAVLSARELSHLAGFATEQARDVAGRFARHVWQGLTDLLARQGIHLSPKEEEGVQVLLVLLLVVVVCIFLLVGSRVPGQRWEIYYPY